MYEAHDALLCIAEGTILDNPERRRLTPTHCFRSAEEMRDVFIDLPEALDNTLIVAQRCNFMPDENLQYFQLSLLKAQMMRRRP